MTELEQIISEIEAEDIDVDVLAEKVRRAASLVKLCKARLRNAEEEVKKVLTEIEAASGDSGTLAEGNDLMS